MAFATSSFQISDTIRRFVQEFVFKFCMWHEAREEVNLDKKGLRELPEELVEDIFVKLPAVSLLRFKCLSRSWRATIDNPRFAELNLWNSTAKPEAQKIFLVTCFARIDGHALNFRCYNIDYESLVKVPEGVATMTIKGPIRGTKDVTDRMIIGSCNGVICLHSRDTLVLFNPCTAKYRALQSCPLRAANHGNTVTYEFGYDKVSNDYKVVRLTDGISKIYSSKSNSWRNLPQFPYKFVLLSNLPTFANCQLYWVTDFSWARYMITFDIASKKWRVLTLPEHFERYSSVKLKTLSNCLCVMGFTDSGLYDMWALKDSGNWVELVSQSMDQSLLRPISYIEEQRRLLCLGLDNNLIIYDIDKKAQICKFLVLSGAEACHYVSSLVQP